MYTNIFDNLKRENKLFITNTLKLVKNHAGHMMSISMRVS